MSDVVDKSETESVLEEKKEEEPENEVEEKDQPLRENMINNAVKFLSHDTVKKTPLVRRVAFLEQKGLTSAEITEAMRRVSSPTSTTAAPVATPATVAAPVAVRTDILPRRTLPPPPPPPPPSSNFKVIGTSVFLTLTAVGGVYWLLNKALNNNNSEQQANATTKQPTAGDSSNNLQTQMTELVQELRTQRLEVNDTLKMVHTVLTTPERAPQKSSSSSIDQVNVKELTAAINGLQSLLKETQLNQVSTPNNNSSANRVPQSPGTPSGSTTPLRAKPNSATTIAQPPVTVNSNSNNTVRPFTATTPVTKNPPPTRSIAEITEMVKNGVEIPGYNPLLNDTPLDNSSVAAQSSTERPKKPWQERREARSKPQVTTPVASPTLPAYLSNVTVTAAKNDDGKPKIEIIETEKELVPPPAIANTEEKKNEESE